MHLVIHNKHMFKHSISENLLADFTQVHILDSSNITNILYDVCNVCLVEKKHQSSTFFFSRRQSSTFVKHQSFPTKHQSSTLQESNQTSGKHETLKITGALF